MEIASIANGYQVLNIATSGNGTRVLDASPVGTRFLILMQGGAAELREVQSRVQEMFDGIEALMRVDMELLVEVDARVTEAVFALAQVPLHESLVVVETSSVSGCLQAAQTLVNGHGLVPIEIRIQRSSSGGAYGFFTGSQASCAPAVADVRTKLSAELRQGRVELIERPTKEFRSFFQISGDF